MFTYPGFSCATIGAGIGTLYSYILGSCLIFQSRFSCGKTGRYASLICAAYIVPSTPRLYIDFTQSFQHNAPRVLSG